MQSSKPEAAKQVGSVQSLPPREVVVSDLAEGALFEVCGIRYIKIHSNACRAYVRQATRKHVVIRHEDTTTEFDTYEKGCINISRNTLVTRVDEAEDLI